MLMLKLILIYSLLLDFKFIIIIFITSYLFYNSNKNVKHTKYYIENIKNVNTKRQKTRRGQNINAIFFKKTK